MKVYVLKSSVQYRDAERHEKNNYKDPIGVYTSLGEAIVAMCDDVTSLTERYSSQANITFKRFGDRGPMDYDERRDIGSASFDFGKYNVNVEYSVYTFALDNFIEEEEV